MASCDADAWKKATSVMHWWLSSGSHLLGGAGGGGVLWEPQSSSQGQIQLFLKGRGGGGPGMYVTTQPFGCSDGENACRRRICLSSMKHAWQINQTIYSATYQHFGQTHLTKMGGGGPDPLDLPLDLPLVHESHLRPCLMLLLYI